MNLLASWIDGKEQLSLNPIVIILKEKKKNHLFGFCFFKAYFLLYFQHINNEQSASKYIQRIMENYQKGTK